MPSSLDQSEIETIRAHGRSMQDNGFVEVNLVSGHFSWANEFVLNRYGFTLAQLQSMTVFDLVPEKFHDGVRNSISDQTNGKSHKFSIWPGKNAKNQLIWWYSIRVNVYHPLYWFRTEYMNTTDESGPAFASMQAVMETTNSYNDLYNKFADFQGWTEENFNRLNQEFAEIKNAIKSIKDQVQSCLVAANRAANAALENAQTINLFKSDISRELSNHTAEILMLITTDTVHDRRLQTFEDHMKETTNRAVLAIQNQAKESGKGLTKKVTIPVGAIAAIATLVQWLIQHWPHR